MKKVQHRTCWSLPC